MSLEMVRASIAYGRTGAKYIGGDPMIAPNTWSLVFTREELYFLACVLQITSLIGLEDPSLGLLAEEVEEFLERAKQSLAERGLLEIQSDGKVVLDAGVAALISPVAFANCTLITSRINKTDGMSYPRYIHLMSNLLIEQETLPDTQVSLTAVRDWETLAQRLEDFFGLTEAPAAPGLAFTLTDADLTEARRLALAGAAEACYAFLNHVGVPTEAIPALATALAEGQNAGSVAVLHREAREMHYGESLAWLVGGQGAWRIHPLNQEPPAVRLVPATTEELHRRLSDIVQALRR